MEREKLIKAVDDYCKATGLKPSTVCQYALQYRQFYDKVKAGQNYGVVTAERLVNWMRENPPQTEAAE